MFIMNALPPWLIGMYRHEDIIIRKALMETVTNKQLVAAL
jgi:hypothetical protein